RPERAGSKTTGSIITLAFCTAIVNRHGSTAIIGYWLRLRAALWRQPWGHYGINTLLSQKSRFQCAGLNRHEAENAKFLRERISDPLGPEFCVGYREVHGEA